jgi:hypothetical protein
VLAVVEAESSLSLQCDYNMKEPPLAAAAELVEQRTVLDGAGLIHV